MWNECDQECVISGVCFMWVHSFVLNNFAAKVYIWAFSILIAKSRKQPIWDKMLQYII